MQLNRNEKQKKSPQYFQIRIIMNQIKSYPLAIIDMLANNFQID